MTSPEPPPPAAVAEAFSGHRFADAYPHLADDVEWVLVGGPTLHGRQEVVAACEQTRAGLEQVTATFRRFLTVAGARAVAVDAVAEYVDGDGSATVVSSCDLYEFTDARVSRITSYTVELPQPA